MIVRKLQPARVFFAVWIAAALLTGAILTSYHQPMLVPQEKILALLEPSSPGRWQVVHILSGSCGCSQRVMRSLVAHRPKPGAVEQVVLVEDGDPYLPGTDALVKQLHEAQFRVTHLQDSKIVRDAGLRGVPLLVIVSPQGKVVYLGGYGAKGDQDEQIFAKAMSGASTASLPIFGCAVGERLRRQADPFGLKYGISRNKQIQTDRKVPAV